MTLRTITLELEESFVFVFSEEDSPLHLLLPDVNAHPRLWRQDGVLGKLRVNRKVLGRVEPLHYLERSEGPRTILEDRPQDRLVQVLHLPVGVGRVLELDFANDDRSSLRHKEQSIRLAPLKMWRVSRSKNEPRGAEVGCIPFAEVLLDFPLVDLTSSPNASSPPTRFKGR